MAEPAPSQLLDCPHATRCSGCTHLGTPYPSQLSLKRDVVVSALAGYPELGALTIAATEGATPALGYRVRSKLAAGNSGELGLFARGSHDVVDIPDCRVLAPPLARVAAALRALLPASPLLHAVDLRLVDRGVLVTLVWPEGGALAPVQELARALSERAPEVVGVALSVHRAGSPLLLGVEPRVLSGREQEPHHITPSAPYELVSHGSFTQAHLGQAGKLHARIEQALAAAGARRVLELYSGSCSLALRLSAAGYDVTAVEAFAPALQQGARAASEQGLALKTMAGSAEHASRQLAARGERFDAVLVNPPRAGLNPEVRRAVAALRPALVVYVSCEPATLARDLSQLALYGLRVAALTPFDMIPYSDAVEALALLTAGAPATPQLLHDGERLLAVVKSGYEPSAPQSEHAGSLLERVRRLPRAERAVLVQPLELGVSGVCLFARAPGDVAELQAALAAGSASYLALARGISREKGRIARPLRDGRHTQPARTRYVRRGVHGTHSLLELVSEQGPKHALRRHLASIGHPVLGDARYGDARSNRHFEQRYGLDRAFLHRERVELVVDGAPLSLNAPLAPELARVLRALGPSK